MKETLLSFVQSILSDMDSEPVNSIADSDEAEQIASVIEDTYYNMVVARLIPNIQELISLVALSDSTRPTHFRYDASGSSKIKDICKIEYNISSVTGEYSWREVKFLEPIAFISRMQYNGSNNLIVEDVNSSTKISVITDKMPQYYTSFDNEHIVMDSYDSTVDTTLQASKTRSLATRIPSFDKTSDTFVPDIDDNLKPMLLAEAKSVCFSLFKSGSDPKIEQSARRLKSYTQNDKFHTKPANKRTNYGRKGF